MLSITKFAYVSLSVLFCLVNVTESVSIYRNPILNAARQMSTRHSPESLFRARRTHTNGNENCVKDEIDMVQTIMDRICMLCHELRSHYAPNTRVECNKDCFHNETFQSCMKIFSGSKPVQQVEPTAPVPLYTEDAQTLDDIKERQRRI